MIIFDTDSLHDFTERLLQTRNKVNFKKTVHKTKLLVWKSVERLFI